MMVWFPGESHSYAYRDGLDLLEAEDATYQCTNAWGFLDYTDQYLRVVGWPTEGLGENIWYTWKAYPEESLPEESETIKNYISTNSGAGKPVHAIGFAWCWDMVHQNTSSTTDPVYGVHWYGSSVGGPDGNLAWGLDAEDNSITGNDVSMDTYLAAMEDYIDYCADNSYVTKIIFTTGPVDSYSGEAGYQVYLKHQYIRDYVAADATRIFFDYADILCYDDDGQQTTTTWNSHTYPVITPTNLGDESTGHIGPAGAIRLAKAQWWLLARIAGWDGGIVNVPVTGITVTGAGGATTITADNGTLQLTATVLPADATNKTVTWSVTSGTGQATISSTGLVTAVSNGTVTAKATTNDGSGVYGTLDIVISGQTLSSNLKRERNLEFYVVQLPDKIIIMSNNQSIDLSHCLVYSSYGTLVHQEKIISNPINITLSSLPHGIYIIRLTANQQVIQLKGLIP
jgi:hypothetical protein